jgi:hypothetical protein
MWKANGRTDDGRLPMTKAHLACELKKGGASIIFKKETVNTKFPKDVHKGEFYVSFIFK